MRSRLPPQTDLSVLAMVILRATRTIRSLMQQQRKKCAFGFSCAAMMQQPGLLSSDCPNADTCGLISDLPEDYSITFYRRTVVDGQFERQAITLTGRQAATFMLLSRGCPQYLQDFGTLTALDNMTRVIDNLRSHLLENYDGHTQYIAPLETETHTYNVKRPRGTYQYNKLASPVAIFEPSEKTEKVKVIHLSHDDDPRNLEARAGIERRNKLVALTALLNQIEQSLGEVLAML